MRIKQGYVATAVALGIITLGGCAADSSSSDEQVRGGQYGGWDNLADVPEVEGAFQALALATPPVFDGVTGVLTVTIAANETAVITRNPVTGVVQVNAVEDSDTVDSVVVFPTVTTMKSLVITGGATPNGVILDFVGGVFGVGTATSPGIVIDLGTGGGDKVIVRGTPGNDAWAMGGDNSLGLNTDNFVDVSMTNVDSVDVLLGSGDDTFMAINSVANKGVSGAVLVALEVYGLAGKDIIQGGNAANKLYGHDGDDVITGGNVADTIEGGAGNDIIAGRSGANILAGDDGNDTITGGSDVDTITGGLGDDLITAGDGDDVSVDGGEGNDTFFGGTADDGSDTYLCGAGTDTVSYVSRTLAVTALLNGAAGSGEGGATENDTLGTVGVAGVDCENLVGGKGINTLTGNAGNNTLTGNVAADLFYGLAGNDVINGGDGADTLEGGDGNDTLNGEAGDDLMFEGTASNGGDIFNGGLGIDRVNYGSRTTALTITMDGAAADDGAEYEFDNVKADIETLTGAPAHANTITGNALANTLTGGTANDVFFGGAGDDILTGGTGDDKLYGEDGNDTFEEGGLTNGADWMFGGLGVDFVNYGSRVAALTVVMDSVLTAGVATGTNSGLAAGAEGDLIGADVENLTGGNAADSLTGNAGNNRIMGGLGVTDDIINGGAGDDYLDGEGFTVANTIDCGEDVDIALNGTYVGTTCESTP
jgi:Ca2+-binding RTX toxin-like protein